MTDSIRNAFGLPLAAPRTGRGAGRSAGGTVSRPTAAAGRPPVDPAGRPTVAQPARAARCGSR